MTRPRRGRLGSITKDQDLIEEFWSTHAEAWFDGGRDDPAVAMLRVYAESAELQSTDNPKAVAMVKYAKSMVTKERPDVGDATRVEF